MEEYNYINNFHEAVEEAEEVLSLCDLPMDEQIITSSQSQSQSQSHDQCFEFMSDQSFDLCPAEDIFFCGKLIPFTPQAVKKLSNEDKKQGRRLHQRSGSLSELESYATPSNSTKDSKLFRTSRSLDDKKLRRFGDSCIEKSAAKPKWYFPMIGIARFPPAGMDIRDIKSRQVRRSSLDGAKDTFPSNRSSDKGSSSSSSSWRFIKALSCNDHASVAVTSSLCVSHA